MKNVTKYNLKNCIFKTEEEMLEDLKEMFLQDIKISCVLDGIYIEKIITQSEDEMEVESITREELFDKLAEYYDVKEITSIHTDNSEYLSFWICYKNDTENCHI